MSRVFVDANIPMYAAGAAHLLVEPARRVIASAAGKIDAVTDAEVFQEILCRYLKVNQREKGFEILDAFHRIMLGPTHDVRIAICHVERHTVRRGTPAATTSGMREPKVAQLAERTAQVRTRSVLLAAGDRDGRNPMLKRLREAIAQDARPATTREEARTPCRRFHVLGTA